MGMAGILAEVRGSLMSVRLSVLSQSIKQMHRNIE